MTPTVPSRLSRLRAVFSRPPGGAVTRLLRLRTIPGNAERPEGSAHCGRGPSVDIGGRRPTDAGTDGHSPKSWANAGADLALPGRPLTPISPASLSDFSLSSHLSASPLPPGGQLPISSEHITASGSWAPPSERELPAPRAGSGHAFNADAASSLARREFEDREIQEQVRKMLRAQARARESEALTRRAMASPEAYLQEQLNIGMRLQMEMHRMRQAGLDV